LDLVVSDVDRSKTFYSALLRGLGWSGVLELEGERGETIWYLQAADTWLGLREKQSDAHPVPYDRYAVGVHHLAFEASTRDAVDSRWAVSKGEAPRGHGQVSDTVPEVSRGREGQRRERAHDAPQSLTAVRLRRSHFIHGPVSDTVPRV